MKRWRVSAVLVALLVAVAFGATSGCATRHTVAGEVYATIGERRIREPPGRVQPAAGDHRLSLEAATVMMLERSTDLAVRRLDPVIAETFEALERAEFGATLFGSAQYQRELSREVDRATMMRFDVEGSRTDATVGVRQRTPIGTEIETSIAFQRDESSRTPEQQELRAGLTITQSLLRGLDPDVQLASVHHAEMETRATQFELRAFVTSLLLELETAYWRLALAMRSHAIHEQSLAVAEGEAAAVAVRIEVGDLAPADATVVEAQVALLRQALIDSRAESDEWALRLRHTLHLDPDSSSLTATDVIDIEPVAIEDPAAHYEVALRMRADLNEARVRLEQNRLDTVATGNGLLPRLDLFVQLAKTGFGSSFGEAVAGLGEPTYEVAAGLSFEQLLGNGGARALDDGATLRRERAERAVANLENLVRLDVSLALNEIARARAQIDASRATAALLARIAEAERERFEIGESTALVVAQADRDLVAAQVAEVEALVTYRIALVRLYAAEGSLLERRGVRLAED